MLFGSNLRYFNELEINGENVDDDGNEDYTSDQLEPDDDDTEDETIDDTDTGDDLDDFTEDEFDDEDVESVDDTDEEPTEDESAEDAGDDLDDYTEDEFDDSDGETTDDAETGEETEPAEDESTEDDGDDLTDFTEDDFDADGGETDDAGDDNTEGADAEGEGDEGETTDDSNAEQDSGDQSDNTLAGMEKNLFSDLSPQQIAIKNNELLQNYIELYETINTIFDSINKIPKTFNNTRPLTFIADQLVSLKDMVNYVITTTYVTRTYVENMAYYKQALVVLEQLNTMLKALVQKPTKS